MNKKYKKAILFLISIMIIYLVIIIYIILSYMCNPLAAENKNTDSVSSNDMKKLMLKVGPMYDYREFPNGRAEVFRDNRWKKIRNKNL